MPAWEPLATERIMAISEEIVQEDVRLKGRIFDEEWIDPVPAADGEIMLRITGEVIAADIIQMDQEAVVRAPEPMRTTQSAIPKLKHGRMISEEMLDILDRISQNIATSRDRSLFDNWVARSLQRLLDGIRDRRELLYVAMMIDDGDYDRFGIKFSNLSWGTPADLKTTPTVWSNPAATPISDIETLMQTAEDNYGEMYDTIVMTRQGFNEMVATDEFSERAQAWFQLQFSAGNFPTGNRMAMQQIAEAMLARPSQDGNTARRPLTLQIYNKKTKTEAADGTKSNLQFLPDDRVLLLDSNDKMNPDAWDFANGRVMETMDGLVPDIIGGGFGGTREGPVSYATAGDPQGNPPGQVLWAVQRGFPRKHRESANAVISI